MTQNKNNHQRWVFNKQINLSIIIQLSFLAILIIGTWVNLQKQLTILQHDMTRLIQTQQRFQQKVETLDKANICFEYRLVAVEKTMKD
jgi:hypothetical protein